MPKFYKNENFCMHHSKVELRTRQERFWNSGYVFWNLRPHL